MRRFSFPLDHRPDEVKFCGWHGGGFSRFDKLPMDEFPLELK